MVWPQGKTLQNGKYILEKELGRGRFGTTYLAKHKDGERLVIKTLSDDLLNSINSPDELKRLKNEFVQEGGKLARCNHEHIVEAGVPFLEEDVYCIAMEYIGGPSLSAREQKILPEATALEYIKQVGEALIVVHGNQLVHRDVKPENILLRLRNGKSEAVLIDFGLALEFARDLPIVKTELTTEYAPPELYSRFGGEISPRTDVYSLAATLYDLLTGEPPTSAIERESNKVELTPPISLNDQISPTVSRQIVNALNLKSDKRPAMREWLKSLGLTLSSPLPTPPPTPPPPIDWKWIVATTIAFIAALGGLAAWIPVIKPPSPSPSPMISPIPSPSPKN